MVHCHWGYAASLYEGDFWGDDMHLCNGTDDTGCNGPDGERWVDEGYSKLREIHSHTTRECHRLAATGEYPDDCAYRSYDPRTTRDCKCFFVIW